LKNIFEIQYELKNQNIQVLFFFFLFKLKQKEKKVDFLFLLTLVKRKKLVFSSYKGPSSFLLGGGCQTSLNCMYAQLINSGTHNFKLPIMNAFHLSLPMHLVANIIALLANIIMSTNYFMHETTFS